MSSPSAVGRRRGLPKQMSSEDQALNMIAREAEARLAAKRAARAEARSIRMKELEKKQKEADEQMDKEYERDYEDPSKRRVNSGRAKSSATSSLNTSESSLDGLGLQNDEYVKQLKDNVKEVEDKFRKAMVNSAQLDNERQAFQYQVEILKDIIEDITESLDNVQDELTHKSKEYNKLSREHEKLNEDFEKCTKILADRDRILDEHGINLDGSLKDQLDGDEAVLPEDLRSPLSSHTDENGSSFDNAEKELLLTEISDLKEELADLRNKSDVDLTKREADSLRIEGADLERSFVDVSDEASVIQDNIRHQGLYVNNNEKCDEFEVIDNSSHQGGIRNFEDRSFEQSGRSSLLSSVQTSVTESMESEIPLEISVDLNEPTHQERKDEYDIVQSYDDNEPTTPTSFNIDALTSNLESSNSPVQASDININKYFISDSTKEDADEDLHFASTFSVDKYFATEEPSIAGEEKQDTTSDELHFENIEAPEVPLVASVKDSEEIRCSPYLEVDANLSSNKADLSDDDDDSKYETGDSTSKPHDDTFHAVSLDDINNSASSDNSTKDPIHNPITASLDDEYVVADISKGPSVSSDCQPEEGTVTISDSDISAVDCSLDDTKVSELDTAFSSNEDTILTDDLLNESTGFASMPDSIDACSNNLTANDGDTNSELSDNNKAVVGTEESELLNTLDEVKPVSLNKGVFVEDRAPLKVNVSLSEEDKKAVRMDVENLYDLVAGCSDSKKSSEVFHENDDLADAGNKLPANATFGVFAISSQSSIDDASKDAVEAKPLISTDQEDPHSETVAPKRKEGWLVRVESFTAPKSKAPEIKVVNSNKEMPVTVNEGGELPSPVPKERKKKKKKKSKTHNKKDNNESKQTIDESPALSAPELLGFASESPSLTPNPSPSLETNRAASNSDIPQQFLDASFNIGAESDISDTERDNDENIGDDTKKKSSSLKRGSKKENCKTQ